MAQSNEHFGESGKHGQCKAEVFPNTEVMIASDPLSTVDTASSFCLPSHMPVDKLLPLLVGKSF